MQEAPDPQLNALPIKEHPDLYRRATKGGYWVVFLRLAVNLLGFAKTLIIANFFYLEDLGIISIALMMMGVLTTFTETGFDAALIQKKEDIDSYLNTAWTAGVIKGIVLFLILFLAAPFLASIRVPQDKVALTISVLRAMSVCFLINGVRNIGTIYFQKELDFRKVFTLNFVSSLADIILSVALIFILRSVWGVIAARVFTVAVNCAGSYILSPYRPRFRFVTEKARGLWGFGKWIYGLNILGYCLEMGDNFFVWFYLGLPQLALYKYAFNFANMPSTHMTQVFSMVSFPAYSKIQDDLPRLREAFLKIFSVTVFIACPVSFLLFMLGPDFIRLFLQPALHPMTPAFQILALNGFISAIGSTVVLKALKLPHVIFYLVIGILGIILITIYPFTKWWGITGTALSITLAKVIMFPVGLIVMSRILRCTVATLCRPMGYAAGASLVMAGVLMVIRYYFMTHPTLSLFIVQGVVGCAAYGAVLYLMDKVFVLGLRPLISDQLKILKSK